MAAGGQSSQHMHTGVQEQTEHDPDQPLSACRTANACLVSGQVVCRPERPTTDCCEVVKVELKAEFQTLLQTFKTEMNTKIDSMKSELSRKNDQIDRLMQDREKTHGELENLREKLKLKDREKWLDERDHQRELQEKNDENKSLRDRNKELTDRNQMLEAQVKTLTDEKKRLEEDIRNHTQKVATLEAKLDNMKNDNADIKRELAELKADLATNRHQCNHDPESMAALEARMMEKMTEKMTQMMSSNVGNGRQSLSHSSVDKLRNNKSGGSSKSKNPLSPPTRPE